MTQLGDFRTAWAQTVQTAIADVNVSGWYSDGVKKPRVMLIEEGADSIDILSDFGSKYATVRFLVVVEETSADDIAVAQRLDELVSWDSERSVWAAIRGDTDDPITFGTNLGVHSVNLSDAWTVDPLERRATLPMQVHFVKAEPEEP